MLQKVPRCQWVPLLRSRRTLQSLWAVAVMLTQQLITAGSRREKKHLNHQSRTSPSLVSELKTVEIIPAESGTWWETNSLRWKWPLLQVLLTFHWVTVVMMKSVTRMKSRINLMLMKPFMWHIWGEKLQLWRSWLFGRASQEALVDLSVPGCDD